MGINLQTTLNTGCKINLFLQIGPLMSNGYHSLETLFIPLATPGDALHVSYSLNESPASLQVQPTVQGINPMANSLTKAFTLYSEKVSLRGQFSVVLEKNVPHGAGLGGGSANAAGLLLFLQDMAQKEGIAPLSSDELRIIGAQVGADVPFFLENTPALATGIGDQLTPCSNPFSGWTLILSCPDIQISTAWAFAMLDASRTKVTKKMPSYLTTKPHRDKTIFACKHILQNDFEDIIFKCFPLIGHIRDLLLAKGAEVALLSGTGSSIFGLFKDALVATEAMQFLEGTVFMQRL